MNFQLETPTPCKMTDFVVLSDKDREPDTNPGLAFGFTATLSNEALTMFDGGLRSALYTKNANSVGEQASIVVDLPNLTGMGKALGQFAWESELTGYTLTFDHGLAGASNIVLSDCKLSDWKFLCKEGGSVQVKFKVEAPDVAERHRGKLTGFKSQEVSILLAPPEVEEPAQQPIEDDKPVRTRRAGVQTPAQALASVLGH